MGNEDEMNRKTGYAPIPIVCVVGGSQSATVIVVFTSCPVSPAGETVTR